MAKGQTSEELGEKVFNLCRLISKETDGLARMPKETARLIVFLKKAMQEYDEQMEFENQWPKRKP